MAFKARKKALITAKGLKMMSAEIIRQADLFENILLPHELLALPVRFVDHDLQDILATVGNVHYEEHQVLQKLRNSPDPKGENDETQLETESLLPTGLVIPPLILRDGAFF